MGVKETTKKNLIEENKTVHTPVTMLKQAHRAHKDGIGRRLFTAQFGVHQHGGTRKLESTKEAGTAVIVTLPYRGTP